ncbi:hypothetical protein C1H71_07860 [Iodobacter fluviatilis]|uniref:diguanylate cyclase n=2 Tax=Iodobacter fluviatilis TaxID=537 RepID=A0A7G3G8V7_9NEIS|nr:hypothetical protein C1H71_07860 [Iodobacter fluviatilis]
MVSKMMIKLHSGIRFRLAVIFLACFTMMATLGAYLLQRNLHSNFLEIEQDSAIEDVTRVIYGLNNELRYVKIIISDWGNWNELYQYSLDKRPDFYTENLGEQQLKTASLSVVQITGRQNEIISYEQQGLSPKETSAFFSAQKNRAELATLMQQPEKRVCGFLKTVAGLVSTCWRAILHSDGSGPASGILMMGRLIEAQHLQLMRDGSQLPFSIVAPSPNTQIHWQLKNVPDDFIGHEVSVQFSDKTLTLHYPLYDTNQNHIYDIQLIIHRKILSEGQGIIQNISIQLVSIAMLCCAILIIYLHYTLVQPLKTLQKTLAHVRAEHSWSTIIKQGSDDEIGQLGQEINGLLQVINNQVVHLENLSLTDSLCDLANRRSFDLQLRQELNRCKRLKHPLALLILDIDFFKQYNDHYGHPAGDLALKTVSNTLKSVFLRLTDLPARIGGEEFAVLMPNTDEVGALQITRTLQASIERRAIPHEASKVSNILTVSIGLVIYKPQQSQTAEELIEQADQLLYQAKKAGRNQICMHIKNADI